MAKPWTYGETMMIVREKYPDYSTHPVTVRWYGEIPELNKNFIGNTKEAVFDAIMAAAKVAVATNAYRGARIAEIQSLDGAIHNQEIQLHNLRLRRQELPSLPEVSENDLIDGDPAELAEDEPKMRKWLHRLDPNADGKYRVGCLAFRLHRDYDADGDLDHAPVMYPGIGHKHLVTTPPEIV